MKLDDYSDHQLLALWAAQCAEHVLAIFTDAERNDERPITAIAAARGWVCGDLAMVDARKAAFAAHAAAREAIDQQACFVARAAGHAAATAHVADHAQHAAAYALKAVADVDSEREWQRQQLPAHLHSQLFSGSRVADNMVLRKASGASGTP